MLSRPITPADLESAFLRERSLIARICLGYLHNADDADDAAQETFARVIAHANAVTGDLSSYMKMTARNVCRDQRRRREVEQRCPGSMLARDADDPQSVAVELQQLAAVLPHMSRSDLRLIALHFAGFSYEEIARRLGRSLTSVSVGLTRARKRARQLAESPARLGAWLGLLSPWRHAARLRGALSTHEATMLSQCATVLTALILLTTPFAAGANAGVPGPAPSVASSSRGSTRPAELTGRTTSWAGLRMPTRGVAGPPADASARTPRSGAAPITQQGGAVAPSPQSTAFFAVVASPGYAQNHAAYASGYSPSCACGVYFVTHDAARSWHLLPAVTLGGTHLLSVSGPGDRLFAFTYQVGLQVSTPGGTAFGQTIPAAHAAMAPDGRDVMLATPTQTALVRYDADTMRLLPGPRLPPKFQVDDLAYVGPAGKLLVAGYVGSSANEVILACSDLVCTTQATLAVPSGLATLVTPPAQMGPWEVALSANGGSEVLVSSDTGQTWRSLFPRWKAFAGMVAFIAGGDGAADVVVGQWIYPTYPAIRFRGASLTPAPVDAALFDPWPLNVMAQLPDGRLLVNFGYGGPHGLLCSTDNGASWASACP